VAAGEYVYVADCTLETPLGTGGPAPGVFQIEYRIGYGMTLSQPFIDLLNGGYGILPSFAGSSIKAVVDPAPSSS
jgi:hypothetical protein